MTNHLKILTRGESQVIFLLGPHTFSLGTMNDDVFVRFCFVFIAVSRTWRIKVIAQRCSFLPFSFRGNGLRVVLTLSQGASFVRKQTKQK